MSVFVTPRPDVLSHAEARQLTDKIKRHVADLLPLIKEAYDRRADVALGYASWPDYCDAELTGLRLPVAQRRGAVAELRESGMSTRAIGSALGMSQTQVRRDLPTEPNGSVPDRITGLDGREQPAARPTPPADPLPAPIAEQIQQRIATKTTPAPEPAPAEEPEQPRPPKWDPAEREAHMAEVRRIQDIEAAHRQAKSLVPDVLAHVLTVLGGYRLGERHLITRDDIAKMRGAIDLLEKEITDDEQ